MLLSFINVHSQYPRLEAVRGTDMGTFRDWLEYVYILANNCL